MQHARKNVARTRNPTLAIALFAVFCLEASAQEEEERLSQSVLDEVVVTGSRIERTAAEVTGPVIALDSADLARGALDSVGKILQNLPGNTGSPVNTNKNNGGDGSVRIDLRGIGACRTIVLVNGRRFLPGGVGGDCAADLNMIPLSLVERVEVLSAGASTIYGADAVAGVVNLITRGNYHGAELATSYSTSEEGDGEVKTVSFVAGQDLGSSGFTFGGELISQQEVFQGQREYAATPLSLADDGETLVFVGSSTVPQGRFLVPDGNALALPTGAYTVVDGAAGTSAADFRPFVPFVDSYNFAPINYLQTPSDRTNFWFEGHHDLFGTAELFLEGLLHHRESEQLLAPTPYSTTFSAAPIIANGMQGIPANNYYNPFRVDLNSASKRFVETVGRRFSQDMDTRRFVLGGRGDLSSSWDWEISYTWSENVSVQSAEGALFADRLVLALGPSGPDVTGRIVCGVPDPVSGIVPQASVIPDCVPLNLFGGSTSATPEMLSYVSRPLIDEGRNTQRIADALVRGTWGQLGAGDIEWAWGAQYREEGAAFAPDPASLSGIAGGFTFNLTSGGEFHTSELYGEARVPLLRDLPGARDLTVSLGARVFDFSSFGSDQTLQAGLRWEMIEDFALRASYAEVFRAPDVAALYASVNPAETLEFDPCGNDPTPEQRVNCEANGVPGGSYVQDFEQGFPYVYGGNGELQPETGETTTVGISWHPRALGNWGLTVDWWWVDLSGAIGVAGVGTTLGVCANLGDPTVCGLIQRNADGSIALVDDRNRNLGAETAEGVDVQFDVRVPTPLGAATFGLLTTYLIERDRVSFEGAEPEANAGFRNDTTAQSFPRWRGALHADWNLERWGVSYSGQYVGQLHDCGFAPFPGLYSGCLDASDIWYHDLTFAYEFDRGPRLTFAALNVGDELPPRINFAADANTDTATYRLLGRSYTLRLTFALE